MFEKLAHHFTEGGWGMYPIAICSIFIFAIAIERIQFLYFKASIAKDAFVQAMRKYILAGNVGKALALCMEGEAVPIDVGRANEHWFLNAASAGFGAEVTATTSPDLKRLLGSAAYTVMGAILAINVRQYHGRLTLPDREIIGSGPVAIIGNGRQTGGGIQVTPRAFIDDGLLDVLVIRQIPATALLTAARELQQLSSEGEYISYWQTPWVEVHSEEVIPVNLDGEPVAFSSVRYEAVSKAIRVIVPPNCPLLSKTAG